MTHSITLHNAQQARATLDTLWSWAKPRLIAGRKLRLSVAEEKRTLPQNSAIHPMVKEIAQAAQRPTDDSSLRELRYLLLEQWRHETNRRPMFTRSLDGERWVNVEGGTSDLDKPDCSEFLEWLAAFKAQHGA